MAAAGLNPKGPKQWKRRGFLTASGVAALGSAFSKPLPGAPALQHRM